MNGSRMPCRVFASIGMMLQSRNACARSGTSSPGPIMKSGSSISPLAIDIAARSHSASGRPQRDAALHVRIRATCPATTRGRHAATTAMRRGCRAPAASSGDPVARATPAMPRSGTTAGNALWRTYAGVEQRRHAARSQRRGHASRARAQARRSRTASAENNATSVHT